ncbi:glycosyltransferase family 39 protein [Cohnella hashimotonis]|uniref:Glycosyltransferase family 39 protein n=1 Tax=Cohnella hashimotonis TaxID=2826895 RepID=A0ABT6TMC3_9BACL|nr:glycosyltransferase family 39 protein [Cohnella hashimotonis]MDI4647423.1 glycosyltransferase family 39 protein [Cohnella hashimotonis]
MNGLTSARMPAFKPAFAVAFALIFALAAFLRFDFLTSVTHHVTHDTVYYDQMVRQLLEKGVYGYKSEAPNAQVPPGYPLFMAAVYKLVGYTDRDPYPYIRYAQAAMSLATMWIAARIAHRLGGPVAALATAAAMAVYPPFVWVNGAILTETLAALLLLTYLALQLRALNKLTPGASMLAGAALGLAMLARSEFAVLLPVSYLLFWLIRKDAIKTVKLLLCAGLGTALVLSPWILRNVVTLHKPIIASTQVNPFAAGTYPDKNYEDGLVDRHGKTQMEVAKERLRIGFTQHTWTYVKWYTVGKLREIYGRMFFGSGHAPMYMDFPFRQPFHVAIVFGGLLSGALMLRKWRSPATLPLVILAAISVTRLAFVPEYRYNFTAMPILIVLDGLLVAALAGWALQRVRGSKDAAPGKEAVTYEAG